MLLTCSALWIANSEKYNGLQKGNLFQQQQAASGQMPASNKYKDTKYILRLLHKEGNISKTKFLIPQWGKSKCAHILHILIFTS